MVPVAVDLHAADKLEHLAVDADVEESLLPHGLEQLAVMALAASYDRREDLYLVAAVAAEDHFYHLLLGVLDHPFAGGVAVRLARAGVEEPEEVIHLCLRAHRGAGVAVGGLLVDAYHR